MSEKKCAAIMKFMVDLYHGPELDALTKQYVGKPGQTYRNENPD